MNSKNDLENYKKALLGAVIENILTGDTTQYPKIVKSLKKARNDICDNEFPFQAGTIARNIFV